MKSTKAIVLVLSILLASNRAHAQLTPEQVENMKESYRTDSTADLSIAASLLSLSAGWHCGSAVASQIVDSIKNDREIQLGELSRECQIDALKLRLALNEASSRTKKQLQKSEIIKTPETISTFNISFGQMTPLEKVETTGPSSCVDSARAMLARWEKSEMFGSPWTSLKNNSVTPCQVSRRGDAAIGIFVCKEWSMSSNYNFVSRELKMFGRTETIKSPDELARLKKMVRRDKDGNDNIEDLRKWLKADLDAGIHFTPVITLQNNATVATLEVRGVTGAEWQKGMYTDHGAGRTDRSKLPALCTVKADISAAATVPREGRIFN